jgi:prevent-host-death family protein
MKEVSVEQLTSRASELLDAAQAERVVITKNGKPCAVMFGIENKDEEDWDLQLSPEFWQMIEERRRQPTVPLEKVKAELLADD